MKQTHAVRPRLLHLIALAAATLGPGPTRVHAQVEIRSRAATLTVTGRVHAQFNTSSVTGEFSSEFLIRRARLTAEVEINDFVSGKVQPDFGEGKVDLKDAYVRLSFDPAFRVYAGQFKRPFDIFELPSSTQILVIERAGDVRGIDACAGPGGTCSLSRFTEKLQYSDRDIGVMVDGTSGTVRYRAAVTNGTGGNTDDENGAKSYTARIDVTPVSNVRVAGNVGLHDYVNGVTGTDEYAVAYGADVEIGDYSDGLHVQAGVIAGENWGTLDAVGDPVDFFTTQGIVSYKHGVGQNRFVEAVEPVGRVSWGNPDTSLDSDGGWLLTPGFVVHFTGRNKFAVNVDVWSPKTGDTEWALRAQSYLHF